MGDVFVKNGKGAVANVVEKGKKKRGPRTCSETLKISISKPMGHAVRLIGLW